MCRKCRLAEKLHSLRKIHPEPRNCIQRKRTPLKIWQLLTQGMSDYSMMTNKSYAYMECLVQIWTPLCDIWTGRAQFVIVVGLTFRQMYRILLPYVRYVFDEVQLGSFKCMHNKLNCCAIYNTHNFKIAEFWGANDDLLLPNLPDQSQVFWTFQAVVSSSVKRRLNIQFIKWFVILFRPKIVPLWSKKFGKIFDLNI